MDDGARGRRLLLIAALAACGSPAKLGEVGASNVASSPASARPTASAPSSTISALPADFRATFAKLNRARFVSRGHLQDRFAVDVYANDAAKAALGSGAPMPPGAMLAKDTFDRAIGGEKPAGVLAMQKTDGGAWRWIIVDARGALVKDGAIDACASCHAQAPKDFVFPVNPESD